MQVTWGITGTLYFHYNWSKQTYWQQAPGIASHLNLLREHTESIDTIISTFTKQFHASEGLPGLFLEEIWATSSLVEKWAIWVYFWAWSPQGLPGNPFHVRLFLPRVCSRCPLGLPLHRKKNGFVRVDSIWKPLDGFKDGLNETL